MEASKNLLILRDNILEFCNSRGDILGFCGRISKTLRYKSNPAQRQPVQKLVNEINPPKFPKTRTIQEDIIRANYELKWNTTYSENEVGTDFIKRYGWFDLIGLNGLFYMSGTRIMIGYWGANLEYQMHWHEAEEAYVPLAGTALFWPKISGEKIADVGDIVTHKSNEKHWTKMNNGCLLALAIWKGTDLSINPTIFSRDGTKMYEVTEKKMNSLGGLLCIVILFSMLRHIQLTPIFLRYTK